MEPPTTYKSIFGPDFDAPPPLPDSRSLSPTESDTKEDLISALKNTDDQAPDYPMFPKFPTDAFSRNSPLFTSTVPDPDPEDRSLAYEEYKRALPGHEKVVLDCTTRATAFRRKLMELGRPTNCPPRDGSTPFDFFIPLYADANKVYSKLCTARDGVKWVHRQMAYLCLTGEIRDREWTQDWADELSQKLAVAESEVKRGADALKALEGHVVVWGRRMDRQWKWRCDAPNAENEGAVGLHLLKR
ncbi:hypothetical protein FPQ18DRAFT_390070 [Pyronema domesticum]|uniref:Uncharacterized protein n=1 Tax=Pyronema omphalodes (strain CBS 100304) TaxID=1076935 RepID=U4LV36_PYROM|nr:hypothetical protein FPQ18DRAFT_390070 [Pyronema domesticum]CCX34242.1 Protein of unknown function [Pyronema omphalodes CBS 100304]